MKDWDAAFEDELDPQDVVIPPWTLLAAGSGGLAIGLLQLLRGDTLNALTFGMLGAIVLVAGAIGQARGYGRR